MARGKYIEPEEFVRVWTASGSVAEVAETLEISQNHAKALATGLRSKGIALKKMHRGRHARVVDVAKLNQIIADTSSKS